MILTDIDCDETVFQIWKQDQMSSCGVASTWMARGLVRRMSFREGEWDLAQRLYRNAINNALAPLGVNPAGPMTLDPNAFANDQSSMASTLANFGFFTDQLARALRREGLSVEYEGFNSGVRTIRTNLLGDGKAAIVYVHWPPGGGHFVVAARKNSLGDVVFLDPWDGEIYELVNNGIYTPDYRDPGRIDEILYLS